MQTTNGRRSGRASAAGVPAGKQSKTGTVKMTPKSSVSKLPHQKVDNRNEESGEIKRYSSPIGQKR